MRTPVLFLLLLLVMNSLPAMADCGAPVATGDDKVVFLNAFSGAALSSHTVAGQDEETTVVHVAIAKGDGKLHIVAAAATPVIWQVDGDVARVSAFVAAGPATRGEKTVKAGVAGIAAAKLSFVKLRDCIPVMSQNPASEEGLLALVSVKAMTGRDAAAAGYTVRALQFDVGPPVTFTAAQDISGVTDLADVIADGQAEAYEVLPQEAGLEQLIKDGKIIKLAEGAGEYKIVKDIPRYPAGLTGAHAVRFTLGKGIKPPAGDAGHSCVITEETEQPLNARIANNCAR